MAPRPLSMTGPLRRKVRDEDGRVYAVQVESEVMAGFVSHTVFERSFTGSWEAMVGGFAVRRPDGVLDPATLTVYAVQRERESAMQRVARRFLGYGSA